MKNHLRLMLAFLALILGWTNASAQTDVTATYVVNPGFESCTETTSNAAAGSSAAPVDIQGDWTQNASATWSSSAVVAYGGSGQVNGVSAPSADNAGNTGKTLGVSVGWGGTVSYQSTNAVTLPAGHYELKVYAYNNLSGVTQFKSVFGFVPTSGDSYLSTKTSFTYATWETDVVTFDLTENTEGKFQIGGTAISGGSGSNAKVFFDNITLTYTDPLQAAKDALQAEIDKAKLCNEKEGLADAIAAAEAALASATTEQELAEALATLQAADKDAVLRYENNLADASATNGMETSFVVNGTFTDNVNGWTATGGFQNSARASNQNGDFTVPFWENWNPSAKDNKMYQTINNIPNGTYKLKIAAFVNTLADPNESQYVFANDDKTYLTTGTPTFYEVWTVVTNNTVEIGLEQTTATANWMGIDNVSLTYYGAGDVISQAQAGAHKTDWEEALAAAQAAVDNSDYANVTGKELVDLNTEIAKDEPTTAEGYDEAAAALRSATQAFIAAKDNYDALVAEIAKAEALGVENTDDYAATSETTAATALTNTQNLKVAEYNYVTTTYQYGVALGEWTSTATGTTAATFSNEHWSGTTHEYKNQSDSNGQGWNASSWSINFSQDVILPAGNYVFKVAGRQATGNQVNTSLVVKVGNTELGSVSDFPRGNAARGIDTSGATNFSDDGNYANNGNGFGWEWRYVKFTLTEEATVNIAINSVATAKYQWVSFGDYTVQTDNEANISMIAYNIALNDAKAAQTNEDYANVTGEEKTALDEAIAVDETLDKTDKEAIEEATTALTNATSAFTAAKAAYDAFVAAKAAETPELEYAATSKKDALTTAKAAEDATSASDAETKTAAITTALRLYYESHALAEGVEGAEDKTSLIADPNFEGVTIDGTTAGGWSFDQTGGTVQVTDDQTFTEGNGETGPSYFDYYNASNNNQNIHQTIENLAPGRYLLTATGRGHDNFSNNLQLYVVGKGNVYIPAIGNSGGTFGRGWNDASVVFVQGEASDVTIGVKTNNSKAQWWGVTRFRLVKLPAEEITIDEADYVSEAYVPTEAYANVTFKRTLVEGWNGLVLPFDMTVDDAKTVFSATAVKDFTGVNYEEGKGATLVFSDATEIKAGKPFLVKAAAGTEYTIDGVVIKTDALQTISMSDATEAAKYTMTGTYAKVDLTDVNFVLLQGTKYYQHNTGKASSAKAFRAYFVNESTAEAAKYGLNFDFEGEASGITLVEDAQNAQNGKVYNLQGQQVNAAQKGVFIVNGKKIVKK